MFSNKVSKRRLASRLQHIKIGDEIITKTKAVYTLLLDNLQSGRNLHRSATGTGLVPFMSLASGLEIYDRLDKLVLIWGTRFVNGFIFQGSFRKPS